MSSQVEEVKPPHAHAHGPVSEAKMIDRSKSAATAESSSAMPRSFQRQTSGGSGSGGGPLSSSAGGSAGGGLSTTPVQAVTAYLRNLLGLTAKPTKRTLSEEAECGTPDSVREWLRQGSDPNETDAYGYTPLVNACLRGCKKSATVLLANGADPNKRAMHGYTPLHAAAQNGFFELVELLADHGAELEAKNDDGDTPLMLAVRSDYPEVVDALCKRGCDMHTHGFDNIEPIDYALSKRNLYLSDVLRKHERQHNYAHQLQQHQQHPQSPLAAVSSSPTSTTAPAASPIQAAGNADEASAQHRRSLTSLLIQEQEARQHAAAAAAVAVPSHADTHKVKLDRLDSEPDGEASVPAASGGNNATETIFQAE